MTGSRRSLIIAAFAIVGLALCGTAMANEAFPQKPIRIIVGVDPGGLTDLGARKLAELARKDLGGSPIIVENRPGAFGTIAIMNMLGAPHDGYTVAAVSTTGVLIGPLTNKVRFDPLKDLTYLMNFAGPSQAVLVRSDSKYQTMEQLIADAKARPGEISYGTAGLNDAAAFGIKALSKAKGATFNQIPYTGSAGQLNGLLSGSTDFTVTSGYMPQIRGGKLRALAVLDKQRYPGIPHAPTFKELGIDFEFPWIMGFVIPSDVPEPIRKKLESAFLAAARSPDFAKFMEQREVPLYVMTSDEMNKEMRKLHAQYSAAVKEYGMEPR